MLRTWHSDVCENTRSPDDVVFSAADSRFLRCRRAIPAEPSHTYGPICRRFPIKPWPIRSGAGLSAANLSFLVSQITGQWPSPLRLRLRPPDQREMTPNRAYPAPRAGQAKQMIRCRRGACGPLWRHPCRRHPLPGRAGEGTAGDVYTR